MTNTSMSAQMTPAIVEEDRLRADLYALLGRLLAGAPDKATLDGARTLSGDDSDLGQGIAALAKVAAQTSPKAAEREFNALFIGLGRGELLPFASYYLTGFLNEKPLARLREHMKTFGIAHNSDVKEPEDHIATLCEMMAGMIRGDFGTEVSIEDQHAFFNTHIATWAGHFFTDLEGAEGSLFYAPVARSDAHSWK